MLKRLKHALFGHTFNQRSASFCPGSGSIQNYAESGFRVVGKHGSDRDAELDSLRKMAGLEKEA